MKTVKITAQPATLKDGSINPDAGKVFTLRKDESGNPKLDKNGDKYGSIRVENPEIVSLGFAYNGDNVKRGQSALISMTEAAYEKNKAHFTDGSIHPGNVRILETTESGLPGYKAKMAGRGENAQPCLLGGAQIFRKTEFDATGRLEDVLVAHDNVIVGSSVKTATDAING